MKYLKWNNSVSTNVTDQVLLKVSPGQRRVFKKRIIFFAPVLIHSTHLINQQLYWVPFPCQTLCWRYKGILLPALRVVGETQQEIGVFSVEGHLQALGTWKKMGETFNTNCGTGDSFQKTWHPQGSYLCDEVGAKFQKRGGVVLIQKEGVSSVKPL